MLARLSGSLDNGDGGWIRETSGGVYAGSLIEELEGCKFMVSCDSKRG